MLNPMSLLDELDVSSKKRKLFRLLIEKQRRMATNSLYYFSKYVLQFSEMEPEPHLEVCRFIERNQLRNMLILLPRGTFKSSICSVAYPIWSLVHNRDLRFLLSSYESDNTKNWLKLITLHLEQNHRFRLLFGDWSAGKNDRTWRAMAIAVSGRAKFQAQDSIVASSLGSTDVSQHFDRGIFDDLVTDKNYKTREHVDEVDSYLQKMTGILDPQPETGEPGPKLVVGTCWGLADAYARLQARNRQAKRAGEPVSYAVLNRPAFRGNSFVYFPKRFPKDKLLKMKKTEHISDALFNANWLNNPTPEGASVFKLACLGFFNSTHQRNKEGVVTELPTIFNHFTVLDPALGEYSDSDFAAFVTVGVNSTWDLYTREVLREQPGLRTVNLDPVSVMIDRMFEVQSRWKPFRFGVEAVAFQRAIVWGFQKVARERSQWFYVEPLKTDNTISKDMRIAGFEPFVSGGKLFVQVQDGIDLSLPPKDLIQFLVPGVDILVDEMLKFPTGETKDCIDALAYMPQLIFPTGVPEPAKKPRIGITFDEALEMVRSSRRR